MKNLSSFLLAALAVQILITGATAATNPSPAVVDAAKLPRLTTIDERFQSYNVEMVEVTGGIFWKPYEQVATPAAPAHPTTGGAGEHASFYERVKGPLQPIDLSDVRLRSLAAAFGPAYVRVSGSDANAVYFHDSDDPAPAQPPKGFRTVLTRAQWKGVIDFCRAVNGKLVTSFAISAGVRDANGRWTPDQARKLIAYTKSIGGEIAAAELVNEPNLAPAGVVFTPPGYDAETYARDFAEFRRIAKAEMPGMLLLGPGSASEGVKLVPEQIIASAELLAAQPMPQVDVFSYHAYGASSIRCQGANRVNTTPEEALTEEWLARVDVIYDFYAPLRDRFQPGKPMWVTETAQSSCGADPWAKTFLDTFRYLDHLGRQARRGIQTVMYNTLAVSEYGLLERETKKPRPNYWAALLWRHLMGPIVFESYVPRREGLHLYAQNLPSQPGGITLLAINNSRTRTSSIELTKAAQRYTLSAQNLEEQQVLLNGRPLQLQADGQVPDLRGQPLPAGHIEFAPLTITFLAIPEAGNPKAR
jgi:heparanase 1